MIEIELSQGLKAVVDDADADLAAVKWRAMRCARTVYAFRSVRRNGRAMNVFMHRIILGRKLGRNLLAGKQTDHIDCDGLNNARANLRPASPSQNKANARKIRSNTSGYRGVSWDRRKGKWAASIRIDGVQRRLGRYGSREEAAVAYDRAAKEQWGAYARPNSEGMP